MLGTNYLKLSQFGNGVIITVNNNHGSNLFIPRKIDLNLRLSTYEFIMNKPYLATSEDCESTPKMDFFNLKTEYPKIYQELKS